MELNKIQVRFLKDGLVLAEINRLLEYIDQVIKSFMFANEPLADLEIYIIAKYLGGVKVFSAIRGHIVVDKLDTSYSESRELICLGKWNMKKGYKLTFSTNHDLMISSISLTDLHKVLFSLVEPSSVKYVVGVGEGKYPTTVTVDCITYKGLGYKELKECVFMSYKRNINDYEGFGEDFEPNYYLVSYTID